MHQICTGARVGSGVFGVGLSCGPDSCWWQELILARDPRTVRSNFQEGSGLKGLV